MGADQVIRCCIPDWEQEDVLVHCHTLACGGHFGPKKAARKVLDSGFYWPSIHRDAYEFCKRCPRCQLTGGISAIDEMPQTLSWDPFHLLKAIISYQGTHFVNRTIAALMRKYGVHHRLSTPYHPRSNGQAEVSNREIKAILEKRLTLQERIGAVVWRMRSGIT
ncbi:uncharacterized protein LOC121766823 [Salvia splendens]|uniref:uncharacterized protein LOC121766823 n=1 Tax=Salvia splendens TaxID=180675 RepID=UPI001C256070|nr:uncharacterized protein LOC121766823 [Salvia splendens]